MQLLALGHLFFGFAFSQTTTSTAASSSTSAWPLQTFVTKVFEHQLALNPTVFRRNISDSMLTEHSKAGIACSRVLYF